VDFGESYGSSARAFAHPTDPHYAVRAAAAALIALQTR
jgi:hypothetical protein